MTNIPGGNSRGTQRPDLVPGVDPYLRDGVRWLNPAAFTTPQAGTFGNLPRNFLRGPSFAQADLVVSKDFRLGNSQALQLRWEMFNIVNRLNYENPAANLPNGTAGVPPSRMPRPGRSATCWARSTGPWALERRGRRNCQSATPFDTEKPFLAK